MLEADLLVAERSHLEALRLHALLDAGDQRRILGIDLTIDAPVQIARGLHLSARIRKHVTDFADQAARRAGRQPLHEIDLIGVDVESDIGPQLEIEPMALVRLRQVRHRRQQPLIEPLGPVRGRSVGEVTPHAIDAIFGFDAIAFAEQPRQAGVGNGDVQAVRIIVADILPVHIARAQRDAPQCAEFRETIGFDHRFIGRHHRGDRRAAVVLQPHEPEAAPLFEADGNKPRLPLVERGIARRIGNARESPVEFVGPGVIGANELLRAARRAVDQPRPAVAADIGEGAHDAVGAAHDDHAFAAIIDAVPVARRRNVALMTDDLPARSEDARHFGGVEIGVAIGPGRERPAVERIGMRIAKGAVAMARSLLYTCITT